MEIDVQEFLDELRCALAGPQQQSRQDATLLQAAVLLAQNAKSTNGRTYQCAHETSKLIGENTSMWPQILHVRANLPASAATGYLYLAENADKVKNAASCFDALLDDAAVAVTLWPGERLYAYYVGDAGLTAEIPISISDVRYAYEKVKKIPLGKGE
jgi:hypothetical protein